jgi:predicted nucleic acid-binding protein
VVVSDYILDETITALFRNVNFDSAVQFIEPLFVGIENGQVILERVNKDRFSSAWTLRKKYRDKPKISFTDLTSFVIMKELRIRKVFTGDAHFGDVGMGFETLP